MNGQRGDRGKREGSAESPSSPFSLPEIFSSKKTFFLGSTYQDNGHSEIPNLDPDYFPRDEASRRLFYSDPRPCTCEYDCDCLSDGLWACLRRNKQCIFKTIAYSLLAVLVFLAFALLTYNLIQLNGIDWSFKSKLKSVWNSHSHDSETWLYDKPRETGGHESDYSMEFPISIYDGGNENRQKEHYERVETDFNENAKKIEPFFIRSLELGENDDGLEDDKKVVISDNREPGERPKRALKRWIGRRDSSGKRLLSSAEIFNRVEPSQKFMDLKKKLDRQMENFKANAKTVFHPFNVMTPPTDPLEMQNFPVEIASYETDIPDDDVLKSDSVVGQIQTDESEKKERNTFPTLKGGDQSFTGEYFTPEQHMAEKKTSEPSPITPNEPETGNFPSSKESTFFSKATSIKEESPRYSMEAISLAEAIRRREDKTKNLLLNSKVVGGSSDVRLPTGPDTSKPTINAFETLKTGQQLSFTPSAASQFAFPYQMCVFANPYSQGPKPSIRSIQPRTFLPFFPHQPEKEGRYYGPIPPQQNFLSFSVNNYANPPSPPVQLPQVPFTPPAASPFHAFPPLTSPSSPSQQMFFGNGPFPNSQPIFCTYLQPPLFQFPTVPGTADFSHAKCVDCEDDFELPVAERPFKAGRMTLTCSDDNVSCRDGSTCVPIKNWCDNEVHCPDVSDESFCSCRERVARERLCDGYLDCPNGEDEAGCFGCPKSAFSCDSVITPESCIPLNKRCDGHRDCAIGNDEMDCSALFFHVQHNHSHQIFHSQGFLHRNWRGDWFPVCIDMRFDAWAKEACLGELGYLPAVVDVNFASVPDYYRGPFIVRYKNGTSVLQDHCKGHVSTYVKCPPVKCGTRIEYHNLQEMENRFKRFSDDSQMVQEKAKREETGRVVGGRESEPRAWPWAVAIYKDGGFLCGGVILDRIWVLTAAHCMEQYWKHFYEVRGGMLRRFSFSPMEQIRAVRAVIVHENYNPHIMSNDLALLRLKSPFDFNRWILPACLPSFRGSVSGFFASPAPGSRCIAVGWGALRERGADADQLREVEVPILTRCKHKEDLLGEEICAGRAEGGKDTCQGDSGGPLLCRSTRSSMAWYVAGVVSHGEGCARPGEPGAYTRISLFLDWITINANDFKLPDVKPLQKCPGFRCTSASKLCIPDKWICNGFTDCLEAEDEKNCTSDLFYESYLAQLNTGHFSELLRTDPHSDASFIQSDKSSEAPEKNLTLFTSFPTSERSPVRVENAQSGILVGEVQNLKKEALDLSTPDSGLRITNSTGQNYWSPDEIPQSSSTQSIFEEAYSEMFDVSLDTLGEKGKLKIPGEKELRILEPTTTDGVEAIKIDGFKLAEGKQKATGSGIVSDSAPKNFGQISGEKAGEIPVSNSQGKISSILENSRAAPTESTLATTTPIISSSMPTEIEEKEIEPAVGFEDIQNSDSTEYFRCQEIVQSVLLEYVCDGVQDCEDGTDEVECSCPKILSKTKPMSICDGHPNCPDGSDEDNCAPCASQEYYCRKSNSCLPSAVECDGIPDCPSGEDESHCFALSPFTRMKLGGDREPPLETEGLVFTRKGELWRLLCQQKATATDGKLAAEVCADLGWLGYDRYENVTLTPNCTAFRVTCSEGLTNELHHYKHTRGHQPYLWPWNAFVYVDGDYVCSAVLLRSTWLLTSSACLQNISLSVNYVAAKIGSLNPRFGSGDEHRIIRIDAIRHLPGDHAALLHLSHSPRQTRLIRPLGIPYLLDSEPEKDICVAFGEESILLKILSNCSEPYLCYNRIIPEVVNCSPKTWRGVIVCQSRVGWVPLSPFVESKGPCGFHNAEFPSLHMNLDHIRKAIAEEIETEVELTYCEGFRCIQGLCLSKEKVCNGFADCPSGKDEEVRMCSSLSALKGCKEGELKCRNGGCISKIFFADGKDDCGDGSDEPETANCLEYLRLTAPHKICNGKRNCLDKTDEDINMCACAEFKFKCKWSDHCVPEDFVCDGEKDCPGGEDEDKCFGRKELENRKKNSFEIMQKSYGKWHDACPTTISPKYADSLCKDFGFEKAAFVQETNQTVLVPALDPFTRVKLNPMVNVTLRTDKPFVRFIRKRKSCGLIKCV